MIVPTTRDRPMAMEPGSLISPSIRLVSPLATGGMGTLWRGEHVTLQVAVVVKFMSETIAEDDEGRARFSREAVATAQVKSPHVVQTLDLGVTTEGVPFIVTELLEGEDLAARL